MYKYTEKADLRGAECDNNWTDEMENYENDYSANSKISYKNLTAGLYFQNKQTPTTTYFPSVGSIYNVMFNKKFTFPYKQKLMKNIKFSAK